MIQLMLSWIRVRLTGGQCFTVEELKRFQSADRKKRKNSLIKNINATLALHDFNRYPELKILIPALYQDLTTEVQEDYVSAGFIARWLGNPLEEKQQEFPHLLTLSVPEAKNYDYNNP